MANSIVTKIGDGVNTEFEINFTLGILKRDYVTCRVGTEVDGLGDPVYRTLEWITDGLVNIQGDVPGNGVPIVFKRTIPKDVLIHDYSNGSPLTERNLDQSNLQSIMLAQEFLDGRIEQFSQNLDMTGFKIVNLGAGTNSTDAVTFAQLQAISTTLSGLIGTVTAITEDAEEARDAALVAETNAEAAAAEALTNTQSLVGTSTTSRTIGTGDKVFVTQANKAFDGQFVLVIDESNFDNYMYGQATYTDTTELTVDVIYTSGSGTIANWLIKVCGIQGVKGDKGDKGDSGAGTGDMLAEQNLNDVADKPTAFSNIKQAATATATGVVELATSAEAVTGTDTVRAVTPEGLAAAITARVASESAAGIVELATEEESKTGTDTARAVTPAGVAAAIALALSEISGGDSAILGVDFFTANGTYNRPEGATKALVIVTGAGAGGAGHAGNGSGGGTSSFGSHCEASGGDGGTFHTQGTSNAFSSLSGGGHGGNGTGGSLNIDGGAGNIGSSFYDSGTSNRCLAGGTGGSSFWGGGGRGFRVTGTSTGNGTAGAAYGSGGGGSGSTGQNTSGGGGGAGGTAIKYITTGLGATETVTIGSGGSGGGTSGTRGGAGASGCIMVISFK